MALFFSTIPTPSMSTPATNSSTSTAYKASGAFETANGTIYVSKPYRSKTSKKLRALITFAPRKSVFDINNDRSSTNEFRVCLATFL